MWTFDGACDPEALDGARNTFWNTMIVPIMNIIKNNPMMVGIFVGNLMISP
jgi:hypothetical protein